MNKSKNEKRLFYLLVGALTLFFILIGVLGIVAYDKITINRQKELLVKSVGDLNRKNNRLIEANKQLSFLKYKEFILKSRYSKFSKIADVVYDKAKKYGFSPYLIMALIKTESNYNKFAQSSVAYGLMQIHYRVWKDKLKIDLARIFDIEYNVELGCKILRHYMDLDGDISKALFHYNNGYLFNNTKYVSLVRRALIYK